MRNLTYLGNENSLLGWDNETPPLAFASNNLLSVCSYSHKLEPMECNTVGYISKSGMEKARRKEYDQPRPAGDKVTYLEQNQDLGTLSLQLRPVLSGSTTYQLPARALAEVLTWKPAEAAQTPPCLPMMAALVILPVANSWSSTYADCQRVPTRGAAAVNGRLLLSCGSLPCQDILLKYVYRLT